MVHIQKNKINIEIETRCPLDDYVSLKDALYSLLTAIDSDLCNTEDIRPVMYLLKEMDLNYEQLREVIE